MCGRWTQVEEAGEEIAVGVPDFTPVLVMNRCADGIVLFLHHAPLLFDPGGSIHGLRDLQGTSAVLAADGDDDIAFLLFGLGVAVGFDHLLQGEAPVDDWPKLPGLDQLPEECKMLRRAAG